VIWQINSFDQWGVELGKKLATAITGDLDGSKHNEHDSSTTALLERYKAER
jgi:glucose-6-phosphate isomerase